MSITRSVPLGVLGVLCLLPACAALAGQVFVTGWVFGGSSSVYSFTRDGMFTGSSAGPAPNQYHFITVGGDHLYASDARQGLIDQFDLSGSYVGPFANLGTDLLGYGADNLESDSCGGLYAHRGGVLHFPCNAGRYDLATGTLTDTYSHPDLVFPRGMDVDANGYVYVVNSTTAGVANRVFKFTPSGALVDTFDPNAVANPADLAIDEQNNVLYMTDEAGGANAVHAYSLADGSFGVHIKTITIAGIVSPVGLHYEPTLGHLFLASVSRLGNWKAFEVDLGGNVIHTYQLPSDVIVQDVVYVPEPAISLLLAVAALAVMRRRPEQALSNRPGKIRQVRRKSGGSRPCVERSL